MNISANVQAEMAENDANVQAEMAENEVNVQAEMLENETGAVGEHAPTTPHNGQALRTTCTTPTSTG
ncbi:hypothetical protein PF001_g32697 [Phytophthora fragariae]|uniref:Uncharacterized protein n=1 Tax=Phytophthora fragariae TaxID=53985 RepID=A0A6A3DE45_9STRA|nr:hypothetical protein PF009_g32679 [Phytophthora fragariae]KAE9260502.1 hypothetical protein PF001_g32697 [Phytophthora fragariae]